MAESFVETEKENTGHSEADRAALRAIESRAEQRTTTMREPDVQSGKEMAAADARDFSSIEDVGLQEIAAVEMANNALEVPGYKEGLGAIPDAAAKVDALNAVNEKKIAAKEDRKQAEFEAMEGGQHYRAADDFAGSSTDAALNTITEGRERGLSGVSRALNAQTLATHSHDVEASKYLLEQFDRIGDDYHYRGGDKAFSDAGGRVVSKLDDLSTASGMVARAQEKGWKTLHVTGTPTFCRHAWYEATKRGIEVTGYSPTPAEASIFAIGDERERAERLAQMQEQQGLATPATADQRQVQEVERNGQRFMVEGQGSAELASEALDAVEKAEGAAQEQEKTSAVEFVSEDGRTYSVQQNAHEHWTVRAMDGDGETLAITAVEPEREAGGQQEALTPDQATTAASEARRLVGPDATITTADTTDGIYHGKVIGEVDGHLVQQVSPRSVVLHDTTKVSGGIIGKTGTFKYAGGNAKFAELNLNNQLSVAGIER